MMKRTPTVLGLCLVVSLAASPVHAQKAASRTVVADRSAPMGLADRRAAFDRAWLLVKERYHDAGLNGVDWNAVRDRYRPALDSALTIGATYDVLSQMVGELADAHTRVHDPLRADARRREVGITTGVTVVPVEGAPTVVAVSDSLRAAGAPIAPGMRVARIDGAPVDSLFHARLGRVLRTASPHSTEYLTWIRLLDGRAGDTLQLVLVDTAGAEHAVSLPRREVPSQPVVRGEFTVDSVLYLRWDGFRAGIADSVAAWLQRYPDARGVILDMRLNGGGSATETGRVVGHFVDSTVTTAQVSTRSTGWFRKAPNTGTWRAGKRGGRLYAGPLVVLSSPRSGSGAELLASALQELGRATIVGERTCGCLLGISRYVSLPGGGEIAISEVGLRSGVLGRRVEGEGVVPDIVVAPTRAAIAAGVDEARRAATAQIRAVPPG
jgi:C-terminal processing protease CtpA/Prc